MLEQMGFLNLGLQKWCLIVSKKEKENFENGTLQDGIKALV